MVKSILRLSRSEIWVILFIFGIFWPYYPHFNRYRAITYTEYVVYTYLSYKVSFIQKYWYLTNLWVKIYQIWCVCPYMGIWLLTHNSTIFVQSRWKYIYAFRRQIATSTASKIWVLSMLRWFCINGPTIDQIWAWLHRRHRWAVGSGTPSKVWSSVLVYWSTAISKTIFIMNWGFIPPPPPPPPPPP